MVAPLVSDQRTAYMLPDWLALSNQVESRVGLHCTSKFVAEAFVLFDISRYAAKSCTSPRSRYSVSGCRQTRLLPPELVSVIHEVRSRVFMSRALLELAGLC